MFSRGFPSINALNELITQLSYLKKDLGIASKQYLIIDKVKKITQLVIWGDKHDPTFFESFKDSKIIQIYFEMVLRGSNRNLIICSIDCISKLIINIYNDKSLTYLISTDTMTNLLSVKFKSLVIQVAEYYVNFLKTLSQKLNDSNVHLFLNKKVPNMPLAWQSIRFIHHPENLIRNTARNIILCILKLRHKTASNYLSNFPFVVFYSHFSSHMRSNWDFINSIIQTQTNLDKLSMAIQEYDDLYLYFEDILRVADESVKRCIINGFICQGLGFLIGSILGVKNNIGIRTSLFLLAHIASNTQSPFLADLLCLLLFGRYVNKRIIDNCTSAEVICSFRKEWNFRSFWDNYEDKLKQYSLNVFNGKQVPKDSIKQQKQTAIQKMTESGNWFGQSNAKYESQLRKLSMVYGFPYNGVKSLTNYDVFRSSKKQIQQNQLSQHTYVQNSIKKTILKCLISQDDGLTILANKLILNLLYNKNISKEMLLFSGLATDDHTGEKQNRFSMLSILKNTLLSIKSASQGHSLRIKTIKTSALVLFKILQSKVIVLSLQLHQLFLSIYQQTIERANFNFLNTKTMWQKTLQYYQLAQFQCSKVQSTKVNQSDLLFISKETKWQDLKQERIYFDFVAFILLRNLRYKLFPSRLKLSDIGNFGKMSTKKRFQIEKQVLMSEIENDQKISCKIKDLNESKLSFCYLVLSRSNLTIGECMTNTHLRIVFDSTHKNVANMIDRSDPRKLILICNQAMKRNLWLIFEDAKTCYLVKAKLDSFKSESLTFCLLETIKGIQMCLQDSKPSI